MKVLIVKVSALGDIVHALPVLAWLKSADPAMEIDWLVEKSFAPLLEGHPLLHKIVILDTRGWRKQGAFWAVHGSLGMIRQLRREHYDVALDLQGDSKSGIFTRLSGASQRFGFAKDSVREWQNLLTTNHRVTLTTTEHHISERSLAVARAALPGGHDHSLSGPLPNRPEAARQVEIQLAEYGLADRKIFVLHYGTTWPTKLWAVKQWQKLLRLLCAETDLVSVLTWGGVEDQSVVEKIAATTDTRTVIWPRGTLPELAALMARSVVVIGGDTGPVHIAAAVDTPTVSLYRVTDSVRNGPRGAKHIRLQTPLQCSLCLRKECKRDMECSISIPASDVFAAVS
jgi:heptosyltransferase-1